MSNRHRHLVNHTFHGPRFEDGGIDVDTLQDVLRYKGLLVEVAKDLWRRNHPNHERLPGRYEDSLTVRFYEVINNCATIPLERVVAESQRPLTFDEEDELDDAVSLVADTIEAAANDQSLPERFPKQLVPLFREYGKTLRDDEWIEQLPAKRTAPVRYDAEVRQRLTRWIDAAYDDSVDVTGEVTMARVTKPRMAIQLSDGREVEAAFRPEDEGKITTALAEHKTARLRVVGRASFSGDGQMQKIIQVDDIQLLPSGDVPFDPAAKPIWAEFDEILSSVPAGQLNTLPRDGAERHDFYIYGDSGKN